MGSSPAGGGEDAEELNITVAVRSRGRNEREIRAKSSVVVSVPDVMGSHEVAINTTDDVGITAQMNSKTYAVDKVFGPSANQQLIFKEIAEPLFGDFLKGYNCTVLVYGMTSTGKTYTMTGDEKLYNDELSDSAGIIPRILFKLFETLDLRDEDYVVKCSFVELYNEELKDLLDDSVENSSMRKLRIYDSGSGSNSNSGSRKNSRNNSPKLVTDPMINRRRMRTVPLSSSLAKQQHQWQQRREQQHQLREQQQREQQAQQQQKEQQQREQQQDSPSGVYIQNLQDFHITSARDGLQLLQKGLRNRQVATTKMNDFSSRSHTIFTITLYREHQGEMFKVSKMNLVDLAGSENISRSGAQHQRAKEAGSINQSLLTLGRVINSLADKSAHVPFRESKLTRLLQDSLGGNTKTALIATISPAKINSEETCSTLQYASKAKNIKNRPQLRSFIMKDILVKNITAELAKVKSDLLSTKLREGVYMSQDNYKEITNDLESYKTEIQESKRIIERLSSQNSLLLKDKKASNEVNELQRIKLQNMKDVMSGLSEKLESQHKKEQELVDMTCNLKSTLSLTQSVIKEYGQREKQISERMQMILGQEFLQFRQMLVNNIEDIRTNHSGNDILHEGEQNGIQQNLNVLRQEVVELLGLAQKRAEKMYKDWIEKILEEAPTVFQAISNKVDQVEVTVNTYHQRLTENLSDISEGYNNLKQYFNDHFFKNNHEEVLNSHIDKTYQQLQFSADGLLQKFKQMMDDHLKDNKTLMMKSLQSATTEAIDKEMQLFEPQRKKWEESFDLINNCDSISNGFNGDMRSALSDIKSTFGSSTDVISRSVSKVKDEVKGYEDASTILDGNEVVKRQIADIINKDSSLRNGLYKSIKSSQGHISAFDELKERIRNTIASENSTLHQNKIATTPPLGQNSERSPLKPTVLQPNQLPENWRYGLRSPPKDQLSKSNGELKRHQDNETLEENVNKISRLE
ncbi:hypothetical protein ZYGR_0I03290 [Zygosaccharomyces rouxii]|uniref:Kinesin-like protein n=2 Tax=Zygosaccharomyces rouxii TaxID=4956 RepID=C5DTE5_ZYGRC|nr:uncharacterized protein ZYRO0C07898g [Zygosaccharomyces rouxii]KAH9201763.1 P-loop containing nucleoside triphosphate hydrolase protein [Zygosaccharomyces rouxii]GAV48032.1 hypothetical protein ZYGR_0I03290 [Zygosaccharomyces rouxii]CAR27056.1 ZYRO0C07898p [Zygosaccharomyces rouxii]